MPRYITMRGPKKAAELAGELAGELGMDAEAPGSVGEWESDAHDDPGREMLLDRSFADWTNRLIADQTRRQETLTQVPQDTVFEAAEDIGESPR